MMQNKYFILPGIYLAIYKSNSCYKFKMHVKYVVDNFVHNWMHNWIFLIHSSIIHHNICNILYDTQHEPWQTL